MTVLFETDEFVLPNPKTYKLKTIIYHWQLRDLISCPVSKEEFMTVGQKNIYKYNTIKDEIQPLFKSLSFTPVSMGVGHGFLAAGGQRSQLSVQSLDSNWNCETTSSGYINNSICISKHYGEIRLILCNNDETVKFYVLPEMRPLPLLELHTAVNYASVSPDGTKLLVVGDSSEVLLYDISPRGYTKIATLNNSGPGFSCSWNHLSEKFAIAGQDGTISVWDLKSTKRMVQLKAFQQTPQGACRSVKFSPSGSIDLLVFSEHISYINIVDTRTFNSIQTIRVSQDNGNQNIAGITFTPDGGSLFVALGDITLEYKVDVVARRRFPEISDI